MRTRTEILATLIGMIAVPSAVLVVHFAGMPEQPRHAAIATVTAIVPHGGRLRPNLDEIVVRNTHGTGQFTMPNADVRCQVGDQVPVEQQGVTITRAAGTCR